MKKDTTSYVQVENWSNSRMVVDRGKEVAMEIARISCSHCSTCSRRMEVVSHKVHKKGLQVNWERTGGGYLIVIPKPVKKDPVKHLREILELRIRN